MQTNGCHRQDTEQGQCRCPAASTWFEELGGGIYRSIVEFLSQQNDAFGTGSPRHLATAYTATLAHRYTATLSAMLYHVDSTNLVLGGATRAVHISIKSYRAELLKTLHGAS